MNETFLATQRADALSVFGQWVVFTFGNTISEVLRNGRRYHTVEWRGERYTNVSDVEPETNSVKQRPLPKGFQVSARR